MDLLFSEFTPVLANNPMPKTEELLLAWYSSLCDLPSSLFWHTFFNKTPTVLLPWLIIVFMINRNEDHYGTCAHHSACLCPWWMVSIYGVIGRNPEEKVVILAYPPASLLLLNNFWDCHCVPFVSPSTYGPKVFVTLRKTKLAWREGPVDKILARQVWGPRFGSLTLVKVGHGSEVGRGHNR